ncbi:MAG: IclR family transcriptional regulator [Desulfovibrio sp.]|nr:IclR family transcriptional regulator [Desulfovibrio sp.]MBI4959561.1 IclR family transcriptional regulator [Desulfovibrio sp.]
MTSLDKALTLIDALGRRGRAGIKNLAQATGFPPPTVHRLLGVLAQKSYVRQDPQTKEYLLSVKLLELGAKVRGQLDLITLARPFMKEIMETSGETVNLVVFDNFEAVYVEQEANTRAMLRMFTRVGARVPLYCSGVGKAYLAAQDEAKAMEYFVAQHKTRHTDRTIVDKQAFLDELGTIRGQGYAVDNEEMEAGVRCAAALIRQFKGQVAGAMSISGPSARLTLEKVAEMGLALKRVTGLISAEMGFVQP